MPELYKWLLAQSNQFDFVGWDTEYDVLLILSGCPVDCASRPASFSGPVIVVTNDAIDRWPIAEGDLRDAVVGALMRLQIVAESGMG